ncbi:hypothetical protein AnigIFM63309_005352, partial [Aspergillus niger]
MAEILKMFLPDLHIVFNGAQPGKVDMEASMSRFPALARVDISDDGNENETL